MTLSVKFLIIGAGPTGLGAAYRLKERKEERFLIVERNAWVGGLAASFRDPQGFTWDIGGHVQFSHYEYFDRAMDAALGSNGWYQHERESWVWIKNRFVPYPFQNNLRYLPAPERARCIEGILAQPGHANEAHPSNFGDWMQTHFGRGITEIFLAPYNFKVWAFQPSQMAYQWVGERVATINPERVVGNILFSRDDVSWGPNNTFRFPKEGGTGAIWNAIADIVGRDKILSSTSLMSIDTARRVATLNNGDEIHFEFLLSTIPLDLLTRCLSPSIPLATEATHTLMHSSTNIVGIGIRGQPSHELASKCWMYFPESNCPFYRVTLFSKYSPANVPIQADFFSLMTETSESQAKPVNREKLVQDTINGLRATKLISAKDQVVSIWTFHAPYGYPTPSLERDRALNQTIPILETRGIYSRGRFGGWKYEVSNQDHTFMQGVEWVDYIHDGTSESTYSVAREVHEPN